MAFSALLMAALRSQEADDALLPALLPPRELAAVLAAAHRPCYCLQVLSSIAREAQAASAMQQLQQQQPAGGGAGPAAAAAAPFSPFAALAMDANLTALEDAVGTCERILRSPIPLSYSRVWLGGQRCRG